MKLTVDPVQGEKIEGEADGFEDPSEWSLGVPPHRARPFLSLASDNSSPDDIDHEKTSNRVKEYCNSGYYTRAVVTGRLSSVLNDVMSQCDPHTWGIIVEFHPYKNLPLEVMWTDGQKTFEDKDRIVLVYPGCSYNEIRAHILAANGSKH